MGVRDQLNRGVRTVPIAGVDAFDHAVHTASTWLADVARALGTDDRRSAYRMLRAWLHTLRDRLPVEGAAKFSAQLPELLRGVYFEGWEPSRTPIKYGPDEYVARFAFEARVPAADVTSIAPAVTQGLAKHMSPGQIDEALAQLPVPVRTLIGGSEYTAPVAPAHAGEAAPEGPEGTAEELLAELKARVDNLTEAVHVLAEGFEQSPVNSADPKRPARAARLAAEILLAGPSATAPRRPVS